MSDTTSKKTSRRQFLKNTTKIAAASAIAGPIGSRIYAAENNTIKIALVGCGGRGTGAASQALSVKNGPVKLVAMADVFQDRLDSRYKGLSEKHPDKVDVPQDRRFLGFDGYKKAIDCLSPGDVVLLTTPPAFRWVHFAYAIKKGVNVFMEKPITVDGPSTKKLLELAEESEKKNLKVGVGLMVRHCRGRRQLLDRIKSGEIGEIQMLRAYRMGGRAANTGPKPDNITELLYQIKRFHSFLWASGGVYNDYCIHQIDECSWIKGDWPVSAMATGGRHYRGKAIDQNLDSYAVEYTFGDATRLYFYGRNMKGCKNAFSSYAQGTKGTAVISTSAHNPGKVRTYKGHNLDKENLIWAFPQPEPNPYQLEWDDLIDAIRNDQPYNEAKRGAIASLVSSMGRMAAHTGQLITYDQILNCPHEFAPDVDKLTMDSPAPLQIGPQGHYPYPNPGITKDTEY